MSKQLATHQHYIKDGHGFFEITEAGRYEYYLVSPGTEVTVGGTFKTTKKQQLDVTVIIHHQAPHTQANTVLKGAAFDASQIKFTGRIIIDPDCGNSNSFLTERILLLSDQAKAEAIPDLEILTDDVKCSHAATISQIPESQLFYLMSRGLSRQQAEAEIVQGFLAE